MTFTAWRRALIAVIGSIGLLCGAGGLLFAPSAVAADGTNSCGTADWLHVCVTGSDPLRAGQPLRLEFSGNVPDGKYTAGDTVVISVPKDISPPLGATYQLKDDSGAVVATMKVGPDGNLTLTFTDFVDSHTGVNLQGFLQARLSGNAQPGTDDLVFMVGATAVTLPVTVGVKCTDNCTDLPTSTTKYAFIDPTDLDHVKSVLRTPVLTQEQTTITWTDSVGPGQKIDCNNLRGVVYDRVIAGNLYRSGDFTPTIVSCDDTTVVATYGAGQKGLVYSLDVLATITDKTRSTYTDSGSVNINGDSTPVAAEAVAYDGGGSGGGTNPPTSTTTTPPVSSTTTPPVSSTTTPPVSSTTTPPVSSTTTPPVSSTTTPSSPTTTPTYPVGAPTDARQMTGSTAWIFLMIAGLVLLIGAFVPLSRTASGRFTRN